MILGCGFAGNALARRALARGERVIGTVRNSDRGVVPASGIEIRVAASLDAETVRAIVPDGARVLVAFPPDGVTDAAIAPELARARRVVYLSTTGVYGEARGHVDEKTPIDARTPRAAMRIAAEDAYRAIGAVILRAAGIYGPGRGLHLRIARGEFRLPGDGSNVVSRIHVDDLATIADTALDRGVRGSAYVVADDAPVPQIEAVRWLCEALGVDVPESLPLEQVAETLRHDRRVDNTLVKRDLGIALMYPSFREGFGQCIAADRVR